MTDPAHIPPEPLLEAAKPWLSQPNVVGVGLGPKVTAGRETGQRAVLVFVERKQPVAEVEFPVPPTLTLAGADPVPTDVQETGPNVSQVLDQRVRPVPGGYQITAENMPGTGTLGVSIQWQGGYRALTNNHVIALNGNRGAAVYQPDKGARNAIGTVDGYTEVVAYADLDHRNPVYNRQDLAWSTVSTDICSAAIHLLGAPTGIRAPIVGETVRLVGKQSARVQEAKVADIATALQSEWDPGGRKPYAFFDQVVRLDRRCTIGGDSGAAYVAKSDGMLVGIHCAANNAFSWGCRL